MAGVAVMALIRTRKNMTVRTSNGKKNYLTDF